MLARHCSNFGLQYGVPNGHGCVYHEQHGLRNDACLGPILLCKILDVLLEQAWSYRALIVHNFSDGDAGLLRFGAHNACPLLAPKWNESAALVVQVP